MNISYERVMAQHRGEIAHRFTNDFIMWCEDYPEATLWYSITDGDVTVEASGLNTDEEALWILRWGPCATGTQIPYRVVIDPPYQTHSMRLSQ